MCLGDICISCGKEKVLNRANDHLHWTGTAIWLILAGGFKNTHLHCTNTWHTELTLLVCRCNNDGTGSGSVRKASKLVLSRLESTFFLPLLKQRADSQSQRSETDQKCQEAGPNGLQDLTTQGSIHSSQSGDHEREPDSQHSTVASGRGFVPLSQESNR